MNGRAHGVPRRRRRAWRPASLGAFLDTTQFLRSYLWAYWFWLGAAIGCGQLLMLYHLVGGAWGFLIQRILEAALRTMPVMFALAIPLVIGIPRLYSYANPHLVAMDKALAHKSVYLNTPFVIVRLVIYFAVFGLIGYLLDTAGRGGRTKPAITATTTCACA